MYGIVYLTINKINNKKYIGMCKYDNIKNYLGSGKLLKEAIKKYGKDNFERITLEECESFDELSMAEEKWINHYNAVESDEFYNLSLGGFGGNSTSVQNYWKQFSEEERKQLRKWKKPNFSGSNNPMFGKKHSDETKKKIGLKSVNRNWTGPKTDYSGGKNPNAKKVIIFIGEQSLIYDCLKDFYNENQHIPYSTLKNIARNGRYSKRYNLKIVYA